MLSKILSTTDQAINWISKCTVYIASTLLFAVTLVVVVEVGSRYFFNNPFSVTGELYLIMFPWMAFLGIVAITKLEENIEITFIRDKLPVIIQKGLILVTHFIMLFFSVYMTISSWNFQQQVAAELLPALQISRAWLTSSMTISFFLVSIVILYKTILYINSEITTKSRREK